MSDETPQSHYNEFGLSRAAKAWLAGPAAGLSYLTGLTIATDSLPLETVASMTTGQWAGLLLAVLVGYGVTWAVPNRAAPSNDG